MYTCKNVVNQRLVSMGGRQAVPGYLLIIFVSTVDIPYEKWKILSTMAAAALVEEEGCGDWRGKLPKT
jgi:hypothetical protein